MNKTLLAPLEWYTDKRKIKDLIPYEYNPRIVNPVKKSKLEFSLKKFNLVEIPVINLDNKIIAGHQRIYALFDLFGGEEEIDVRIPNRMLTDEEFKEYNLRSNLNVGEWDMDILQEHFSDFDFEYLGFDLGDLNFDTELTSIQQEEEKDFDPEPPAEPKTQTSDVYELLSSQKGLIHRIVCGDSCSQKTYQILLSTNEKFNLVVTDPPYNVNYEGGTKKKLKIKNDQMDASSFYDFLFRFYRETFQNTTEGGSIYVFHADTEGEKFRIAFRESGFKLSECIIWVKNTFVLGRQDYHWQHEPCLYGWKEGAPHAWYSDRKQTTILNFEKPQRNEKHPTMKPVTMFVYLIKNSSRQNELIGDPFLGSGTTLIACEQSWRNCRGIELDPAYVDVAIIRWIKYMEDNSLEYEIKRNGKKIKKDFFA